MKQSTYRHGPPSHGEATRWAIRARHLRHRCVQAPRAPRPLPGKWLQVSDDLNHRKLAAGKFGDIFHLRLENLLVSNGTIKIADFGLARQVSSNPPYTDCLHKMVSSQLKCARFRCIVCT
jgi:serine/threonine protein kinase